MPTPTTTKKKSKAAIAKPIVKSLYVQFNNVSLSSVLNGLQAGRLQPSDVDPALKEAFQKNMVRAVDATDVFLTQWDRLKGRFAEGE